MTVSSIMNVSLELLTVLRSEIKLHVIPCNPSVHRKGVKVRGIRLTVLLHFVMHLHVVFIQGTHPSDVELVAVQELPEGHGMDEFLDLEFVGCLAKLPPHRILWDTLVSIGRVHPTNVLDLHFVVQVIGRLNPSERRRQKRFIVNCRDHSSSKCGTLLCLFSCYWTSAMQG